MIASAARRLRIGVLGCGPIAQVAHLEACRKARNAELHAICDVAADLVERMAAIHQPARTYRDYTMTDILQPITIASPTARRPEGNPKADRRRYFLLTHGSHLVEMAAMLGGPIASVRARFSVRFDSYCWFASLDHEDGTLGHVDLQVPIRGDFQEGFEVFGEHGGVRGRLHLPWFHKAGEVECFSARDRRYQRVLGEDAHTYKRQIEAFAATILDGLPQTGANLDDGLAAMRALAAIAQSAETGESVRLGDVNGGV